MKKQKWHTLDEFEKSLGIKRVKGYVVLAETELWGVYLSLKEAKEGKEGAKFYNKKVKVVKCEVIYHLPAPRNGRKNRR